MTSASPWCLERGCATLKTLAGIGQIQVDQPASGLAGFQRGKAGRPIERLLGLELPGFPHPIPSSWIIDHYTRRSDLIATYERTRREHLRVQVYWRHVWEASSGDSMPEGRADGVHVIVSMQTDRMDSRPSVFVSSGIRAQDTRRLNSSDLAQRDLAFADVQGDVDERARSGETKEMQEAVESPVWLARPADSDLSIVMLTLHNDLAEARTRPEGDLTHYDFTLLGEHLEKGVIRRVQVAVWFVPRAADQAWAGKLYRQLLSAPPPLST